MPPPRRLRLSDYTCPNAGTSGAPATPPPRPRSRPAVKRCAIPDSEHHRPKWQMALEMIDELIQWGRTPPVLTADVLDTATPPHSGKRADRP